jgi:heme-degrading monooxygenase HmoA
VRCHSNFEIMLTYDGGTIMAVKVIIYRKVSPGKEKELSEAVRNLRTKAVRAEGYISGETLRSIEDPSVHLVISSWKSIEDWNTWLNTPERKAFQEKIDVILQEPTKIAPYEYESFPINAGDALSSLEFSVEDE